MELTEIWTNFAGRMAEIELFYRAARDSAKKELISISENAKSLENHPDLKDYPASAHNMSFNDARTGTPRFYHFIKMSFEDCQLHVLLHKNKQYQWLLAEAYEEFEDYLEGIYAYYGMVNNTFWPLKDYGNISLSELNGKDHAWHTCQASKKRNIPHSILNRFRSEFPELKNVEAKNNLQINLSLAVTLVEKFRHIIVHNGGKVSSKEDFIKLVAENSGLYNNGNISKDHIDFINMFFGKNKYKNLITLLEIRIIPDIPFDFHVSLFCKLTEYLMAYAFLIYEHVESKTIKETA